MVSRTLNAEGYMLPLGGPEFWLQAELQDAGSSRRTPATCCRCLARVRGSMSNRTPPAPAAATPDTGDIRLATLYHRDHGIDETLLVLKHELAHWAARWCRPPHRAARPRVSRSRARAGPAYHNHLPALRAEDGRSAAPGTWRARALPPHVSPGAP